MKKNKSALPAISSNGFNVFYEDKVYAVNNDGDWFYYNHKTKWNNIVVDEELIKVLDKQLSEFVGDTERKNKKET